MSRHKTFGSNSGIHRSILSAKFSTHKKLKFKIKLILCSYGKEKHNEKKLQLSEENPTKSHKQNSEVVQKKSKQRLN